MNKNQKRPVTLDEKVDKILGILEGDIMDPKDEGLMGKVYKLESQVEKIWKWKAWILGFSFGAGVLVSIAFKIVFKQ